MKELIVTGLMFDIVGVLILVVMVIWDPHYQKRMDLRWWTKKYSFQLWKPIFPIHPPKGKSYWMAKWNHVPLTNWFLPPKHIGNIVGFLLVLTGFILQIKGNIN